MFIVFTKSGKIYKEGADLKKDKKKLTWDDIPSDEEITRVQLSYPFTIKLKGTNRMAPLLTIAKFDYYYFFNEARVKVIMNGDGNNSQTGVLELDAKVVGGIDKDKDEVIETRLDKYGNCTFTRSSFSSLLDRIKHKTLRKSIIRKGVNVPDF